MAWLRDVLPAVTDAEPDEAVPVGWAFLYFFCLLCGYYILRPVRDEMAIEGGVQHLPWMMTATFVTLLLVTPASFTGEWQWQDLVDTLHDTLDLAKKRAVEPEHVNTTAYARFLPAILSQVATFPISPTLNFAFNNSIQFAIRQ